MDFNHLPLTTEDGTQLNLDALYKIAPSCFTEARDEKTGALRHVVDFDKLRQLLGDDAVEDKPEAYEFTWVGKQAARREAATPINKTLRPVPESSVDWDHTRNIYIEGDNLDALKILQKSYLGKIKMMYFDPPYNTGNDFVYHDDFSQSTDDYNRLAKYTDELGNRYQKNTDSNGKFHSDWCSMLFSRLILARNLLSEDGVIFISIDNNEIDNMKKICDEVFGSEYFISCFAWVNSLKDEIDEDTKFAGSNLGTLKKAHEYILAYGKDKYRYPLDLPSSKYIEKLITKGGNNKTELRVPKGLKCSVRLTKTIKGHVGGTDDFYDIITPEGMIIVDGVLQNDVTIYGPLGNAQMLTRFFNGENIIDKKGQKLIEVYIAPNGMLQTKKLRVGNTPSTVIVGKGTTKNGTLLLKKMFGKKIFDYAKPVELIEYLLTKQKDESFTILDIFSGSATTGHSVLLENLKHNRHINYILVQLPEVIDPQNATSPKAKTMMQDAVDILTELHHPANICELGKERLRRAGKEIRNELQAKQPDLFTNDDKQPLDTGFRVFRVDSSNMKDVYFAPKDLDPQQLDLFADNVKEDRTELDLLYGCMVDWGVQLSLPLATETIDGVTVYTVNDGDLVACFGKPLTDNVVKAMADKAPLRVLFRDSCFEKDEQKINIFEQFKQLLGWSDDEALNNIRVI